jgi:hypothetical protein
VSDKKKVPTQFFEVSGRLFQILEEMNKLDEEIDRLEEVLRGEGKEEGNIDNSIITGETTGSDILKHTTVDTWIPSPPLNRKVIQLIDLSHIKADSPTMYKCALAALCDDGTMWMLEAHENKWHRIKDVPQTDVDDEDISFMIL